MPPGAAGPAPEFQVNVVRLPIAIETVSDVTVADDRQRRTGYSVERDDEHRGRGYDQLDAGSSNVSSGGFAVRAMSATMVAPLRYGAQPKPHEMKNASELASLAPTVSAAHLAAAITAAASMGIREKERVCDRIYAAQPNLLGSVLAQRYSASRCRRSIFS